MEIELVLKETVIALFSSPILENTLVLKGGAALHFAENLTSRLSTDIDFSAIREINDPKIYFAHIESALQKHFEELGYDVIDAHHDQRPKKKKGEQPHFWGGWYFEFKLTRLASRDKPASLRSKQALVPVGVASPKIVIDISEHEYCGFTQKVRLDDSTIRAYSTTLLILEKLRAICQQHPDYRLVGQKRNRGRDFYDIYQLSAKHRKEPNFQENLNQHVESVFGAKEVSLDLLMKFDDEDFIDGFRQSFDLQLTASATAEKFDFYLENVRLLVKELLKSKEVSLLRGAPGFD